MAQRDARVKTPKLDDLFAVGTRATIKKVTRLPNGPTQLVLQGLERAVLLKLERMTPHLEVRPLPFPFEEGGGAQLEALEREVQGLMTRALELSKSEVPEEISRWLMSQEDPLQTAYAFASIMGLELEQEQRLLEGPTLHDVLGLIHGYLTHEIRVLELRGEISSRAQTAMNDEQREYMLRQQLRAIEEELGDSVSSELGGLKEQLAAADLPENVRKETEREFARLGKLQPASPDYGVLRGYLEFLLQLPWNKASESSVDLTKSRRVLDEDHSGLTEVKERVLEHLGVLKLNPQAKAPILCFVGPPGVGKTSLGQSIARALGRGFQRMSLGGMYDEAELRGHRRTYIGAMPGRILQAVRRAGANDPVIMLDEVDKLGRDFRGDPAAALLEILDPEQNHEFRDNYLDQPFDLSKVFFVVTANTLETLPAALLDRLEVIRFSGYSDTEKLEIARKYLVPRQLSDAGLQEDQLTISDDALRQTITGYTREAGVRQLHRQIGKLVRKIALRVAEGATVLEPVTEEQLVSLLGRQRFFADKARREIGSGVAQGLAWTPVGGEVLYVETSLLPDGRGLTLTGQLGDVMRESATTAKSYVWSHAAELQVETARFKESGVHVHVPAGAIPKDGPSAGITISTALTSLYTGRDVRRDTRYDRRGDFDRSGSARWRHQGQAPRSPSRRRPPSHSTGGERKRHARVTRRRPGRHGVCFRRRDETGPGGGP